MTPGDDNMRVIPSTSETPTNTSLDKARNKNEHSTKRIAIVHVRISNQDQQKPQGA